MTVFNSLSWDRKAFVFLPSGATGLLGPDGRPVPVQATADGDVWAEITVPSCGWATYEGAAETTNPEVADGASVSLDPPTLENNVLRLEFNGKGELVSIFDKESGRELAAAPGNAFRMYKDVPGWFDAWDIDSMSDEQPVALDAQASFEVVDHGAAGGRVRITRKLNDSTLTQDVSLRRGSRRVEFPTRSTGTSGTSCSRSRSPSTSAPTRASTRSSSATSAGPTTARGRSTPTASRCATTSGPRWPRRIAARRPERLQVRRQRAGRHHRPDAARVGARARPGGRPGHQNFTYAFYAWTGSFADRDIVRRGTT